MSPDYPQNLPLAILRPIPFLPAVHQPQHFHASIHHPVTNDSAPPVRHGAQAGHEVARAASAPNAAPRAGDLVPGLRTVPYRRRTIIGYRVVDGCVEVLRLVHGGQEWDGADDSEG